MLKKTITYADLDGNPITEDFYFHLTMAEIAKLELKEKGGLAATLQRIVKAENGKEIIEHFEAIILGAYGVRSEDNKQFIKNDEVRNAFFQSEAYSVLFMELIADEKASAGFISGILPAGFEQKVESIKQENMSSNVFTGNESGPARALPYSAVELMNMSPEELANARANYAKGQ